MHAASELIFNFVLNACWQIAAIFAVAALASWLLKNGPARYRHTLWIVALIACFVVPLLTATRFVPAWVSSVQVVAPKPSSGAGKRRHSSRIEDFGIDHFVTRRTRPVSTTSSHRTLFNARLRSCCLLPRDNTRAFLASKRKAATIRYSCRITS